MKEICCCFSGHREIEMGEYYAVVEKLTNGSRN